MITITTAQTLSQIEGFSGVKSVLFFVTRQLTVIQGFEGDKKGDKNTHFESISLEGSNGLTVGTGIPKVS